MFCIEAGDGDTKWSVHYSTQKPKHSIFFIPGKRRSGSADDLRACNRLTQHGRSQPGISEPHPPSPPSSGPDQSGRRRWREKSRKMSSAFSDEEETFFLNNTRPMTPLVLNPIHHTSHWDDFAPPYEPRVDVEVEQPPRLPTPEERMRQQAEAIAIAVVPINITGESFDRQASFRRVASNNDSLSQRYCNLSRRKTITGMPTKSPEKTRISTVIPGQFSTVGRPGSCPPVQQRQITAKEEGNARELGFLTTRRIRAPRGEGMSSLMASLTSPTPVNTGQVRSLPRLATNSSLDSEASCNSISYRALSASSSCSQDMQRFPNDTQLLLSLNPSTTQITGSPSPSAPSPPFYPSSSSLPSSPSLPQKSQWNERDAFVNMLGTLHHLSSSSIADSESQFSYQVQGDQAASLQDAQSSYTGGSCSETWSYRSLSPSSSVHSDQIRDEWNTMTRDIQRSSAEGWTLDSLLCSGRSPPPHTDSNSVCSEEIPTASFLNCEKRKQSTSSTSSRSITRSVSLRKSKRPPQPPLRFDSLRSCPSRTKPCHSSSSPRRKHTTQRGSASSPKAFHDPWVPRSTTQRRQSGFNCGTVSSFESLGGVTQVETTVLQTEHLPPSPGDFVVDVFAPGSPGSEEEGPRFTTHPPQGEPRLQRLASPSSGYSSQSNTPTPGTPVSSPITPSSPLTPSPLFPFPSTQTPFFPPSPTSLPKQKSLGQNRPKPPVPERKSSHLSLSSSFSSTSSLSSCTSSDSSAKHPLLPPPPLPPPQTECVPPVFYSPLCESPACPDFLPPPPPPPPLPSYMLPPPPPPPPSSSNSSPTSSPIFICH
ncbi:NHS-like protein 1 [Takifugu rubripes]|nr:NHS-like protein 1 [Takifugu rubripes]